MQTEKWISRTNSTDIPASWVPGTGEKPAKEVEKELIQDMKRIEIHRLWWFKT